MLIDIKLCHVTENALYCVVDSVFHRNIHSDEKVIGTPPKEVLYLDVGIEIAIEIHVRIENVTVPLRRKKHAVLIYASLTNYTPLEM